MRITILGIDVIKAKILFFVNIMHMPTRIVIRNEWYWPEPKPMQLPACRLL